VPNFPVITIETAIHDDISRRIVERISGTLNDLSPVQYRTQVLEL
jgi:hypothetical protein